MIYYNAIAYNITYNSRTVVNMSYTARLNGDYKDIMDGFRLQDQ